jgi:hypothetical protein
MKLTAFCLFSILVTSCSLPTTVPEVTNPATAKSDTVNFPLQEAVILHDDGAVNVLLSYTRVISTDSSTNYLVLATYKGDKIGFDLRMPPEGKAIARLISLGQPSDDFLRILRTAYHQDPEKPSHFADTVNVVCLSMGAYVDSLKKNGQGDYTTTELNKLFLAPDDTTWEAECYLNIHLNDHCVELKEKESDYQQGIIHDLSRPH